MDLKVLENLKKLKVSKSPGTRFVTKLKDSNIIYIHNTTNNNINKINIKKDKGSEDKYIIESGGFFSKVKFSADGNFHMILFDPVIIAKIGATSKSKENIYFALNDDIDLYEELT